MYLRGGKKPYFLVITFKLQILDENRCENGVYSSHSGSKLGLIMGENSASFIYTVRVWVILDKFEN